MKKFAILLAAAGAVVTASSAYASPALVVYAGYIGDTTSMSVFNPGSVAFTNVVIKSVGGAFPGASETLGALGTGSAVSVAFDDISGAFSEDYDDNYSDETSYQVTGYFAGGSSVSSVFSPSTNFTGDYVDFLGLGNDNDFNQVQVAGPGAVPEAGTWAMMLAGMGVIGFAMRKRNAVSIAFA